MSNEIEKTGKLGLVRLSFFSIGLTLASGVFSLSGDFAANGAYTLAVILGWIICGVGTLGLCMCYMRLANVRPDLTSGIYSYAREGFGQYIGFNIAWGYWLSAILAQVSFITLFFAGLGHFIGVFGAGNNVASIVVGSIVIWLIALLILRGVNQAVTINVAVVAAKILPIVTMVLAIVFARAFDLSIFMENFRGEGSGLSMMEQITATTYTTVWVFIGIEGAVVISNRAKNTRVAGSAVTISFLCLLLLYAMISLLSMGVLTHDELAALGNPPMAYVLEAVVGPWGATLVNIAVIISIGGAMFTYSILCSDSAYGPASQHCFPKCFEKLNRHGASPVSVLASTAIIQLFLIIVAFNESTYQICYTLSTSAIMFPYFFSALYCFKITAKGEGMQGLSGGAKTKTWIFVIIGTLYGIWLLYASGVTYILVSALLYGPGTLLYWYTRKEQGVKVLPKTTDVVAFVVLMAAFVMSVVMISNGSIQPF